MEDNKDKLEPRKISDEIYKKMLKKTSVSLDRKPPEPKPIMMFDGFPLFDYGSMSTIVSKSGNGKSALTSLLASELLSSSNELFESHIGEGKILIFETEQRAIDAYYRLHDIKTISGLDRSEIENRVDVRYLTEWDNRTDRANFIKRYIENSGAKFVVIDGIADLADSINDEKTTNNIIGDLARIALKKNLHICSIIHSSDKGLSSEAMGWLGSTLKRKVSTEINVVLQRSTNLFKVTHMKTRKSPPVNKPWFFTREGGGLPRFAETDDDDKKGFYEDDDLMREIFKEILDKEDFTSKDKLAVQLKVSMKAKGHWCSGKDQVRKDIDERFNGTILKDKSHGDKYELL